MDNNTLDSSISYEKSLEYWADIPATINGMLGGFGFISDIDIEGSTIFLESLLASENAPKPKVALDCGAGIGRISKYLLLPRFKEVDIVEPNEKFMNSIKDFVGENKTKLGKLYQTGLQEFNPERQYDVIWIQWVLGYLNNKDLTLYLSRCRDALSEGGVIIIKENVTSSGKPEKDDVDSSVTRSLKQYIKMFNTAGLKAIKQCKQTNFPKGLYPVIMFALVPNFY